MCESNEVLKKIIAIVFSNNDLEETELTVKSLRSFGNNLIDKIVVYNYDAPDDDFSVKPLDCDFYIGNKDGEFPGFAAIINSFAEEDNGRNDILVMCKSVMVAPGCVQELSTHLHSFENAGVAVPHMNGTAGNQALPEDVTDYRTASEYAKKAADLPSHRITLGDYKIFLLNGEVIRKIGGFDEEFKSLHLGMTDYYLTLDIEKINIIAVRSAIAWNVAPENSEQLVDMKYGANDPKVIERKWGIGYFNRGGNAGIMSYIEQKEDDFFSVLEIGCSKGDTLLDIKDKYKNAEVYGVELDEMAAKIAENFCNVICGNIENENLPYKEASFDYIIFADVLEHLRNPHKALLYIKKFLKPGGYVLTSIPNVQHISVVRELLKGNFTYTPVGLLDHTHIHLFTWNEICRMYAADDYNITDVRMTLIDISQEDRELIDKLSDIAGGTPKYMFETFQYLVKAKAAEQFEIKETQN